MASRDKKRSIKKRNKKKFYTTTGSKLACTKRRRSLTKFGKMGIVAEPTEHTNLSVGGYDLAKDLKENSSKPSVVLLQKLIDKDFPFVSEINPAKDPKPISIPRNSEVFRRYILKNVKIVNS